ncbi:unnamed protein product [Arctia plantaginis]|uniref:Uncharacterized protein n=1 Tax=Arctia plantaginis TaxID=874455 RepID=A0A8S0YT46_ARCPL|nr:unnamed protein product [Arctia plantaginis]
MILLLLLAVTLLANASAGVTRLKAAPSYVQAHRETKNTVEILEENILSMDGHIPPLNDSRRSYAEITHVIFDIANLMARSCVTLDYDKIYQEEVNEALPEALANPQKVVDTAKKLVKTLHDKTQTMQKLIHDVTKVVPDDIVANELIDVIVTNDPVKYKVEANLLLVAGAAATKYNEKKNVFHDVAKTMESNRYIIKGAKDLETIILAATDALRLIYPNYVKC